VKALTELDVSAILRQMASQIPEPLRAHVVVIGSIATAYAFRSITGNAPVATKDIDLLLRPAVDAVATAEAIGEQLLAAGWTPHYPNGIDPATPETPDARLPALRLAPDAASWFVELLGEPPADQKDRRLFRRLSMSDGDFGLASFRFMPIATHAPKGGPLGLRVAQPACMALAHLLEHADPDRTGISSIAGNPPRFVKDVGRAIALWILANQLPEPAASAWASPWRSARSAFAATRWPVPSASAALEAVEPYLTEAHAIAITSVLAPLQTPLDAFRRAHADLSAFARVAR
jgi:hypothetical protein